MNKYFKIKKRDFLNSNYSGFYVVIDHCYATQNKLTEHLGFENLQELKDKLKQNNINFLLDKDYMFGTFLYFPLSENIEKIEEFLESSLIMRRLIK